MILDNDGDLKYVPSRSYRNSATAGDLLSCHPLPRQYKQALMYFDKAIDYTYAAVRVDVAYTLVRFAPPLQCVVCDVCALRVDVE